MFDFGWFLGLGVLGFGEGFGLEFVLGFGFVGVDFVGGWCCLIWVAFGGFWGGWFDGLLVSGFLLLVLFVVFYV